MIELTLFVLLHGYTKEIYEEGGEEWKENKECTWSQSDSWYDQLLVGIVKKCWCNL